ncbi:hypothetical protein [Halosegnis sp.]|uniref:hypothetical protein n=1 Tax=Halosegnis sp. TaxID=2864959 RepID=UPI0035D4C88D
MGSREPTSVLVPTAEWTLACDYLAVHSDGGDKLLAICDWRADPVARREPSDGSSGDASYGYARRVAVSEEADEMRYTEYQCRNCGHATPKNTPPCDRCGGYNFEPVEVRASDFEDEASAPTTLALAREEPLLAGASVVLVLVVVAAGLAWTGAFVLADPTGTYRFGSVTATPPDGDGQLTAGEFRATLEPDHAVTGMRWIGTGLQVTVDAPAASNAAVVEEAMSVARLYAAYVDRGGTARTLEVTVTTDRGDATVTVARETAQAYAAGDLSEAAYRERVLG